MPTDTPGKPAPLERCFALFVVGAALVAAGALALAQLGLLRRSALIGLVAATVLALVAMAWRGARARATSPGVVPSAVVVAVLLLAAAVLFTPPFETALWAGDATVYVGYGVEVGRRGAYAFEDPLLQSIPPARRYELFRNSSPDDLTGELARLPGGLAIADVPAGRVAAGFAPLFPALIAAFSLLFGSAAAFWVTPVFGALGVVVVFFLGRTLAGTVAGTFAALLLLVSLPQVWFSRLPMSAVVAQFFLIGGMWLALLFLRRGGAAPAVAAGFVLGVAALAGFDILVTVGLFVATFAAVALVRDRMIDHALVFLGTLGIMLLVNVGLLVGNPSNYEAFFGRRLELLPLPEVVTSRIAAADPVLLLVIGALAAGAALALLARWERANRAHPTRRRQLGIVLLAVVAAAVLTYLAPLRPRLTTTTSWLAAYLSWPLLVICAAGLLAAILRIRSDDAGDEPAMAAALSVAALLLLYNPQLQDVGTHPDTVRRFVPLVFPGAVIVAAVAIERALRGRAAPLRAVVGATVATLLLLLVARPTAVIRNGPFWEGGALSAATLAGAFPDDAVVLVSPELAGTQVQATLTLLYGKAAMVVMPEPSTPGLLGEQVIDWLRHGRPVYLLATDEGVHFRAPRVALVERERHLLEARVLSDDAAPPRRVEERRVAFTAYRLEERPTALAKVDVGTYASDATVRMRGFHGGERDEHGTFRWTGSSASIEVPAAARIALVIAGARPAGVAPAAVTIRTESGARVVVDSLPDAPTTVVIDIPAAGAATTTLVLEATTFNPRAAGLSDDGRDLGARLYGVEVVRAPEEARR